MTRRCTVTAPECCLITSNGSVGCAAAPLPGVAINQDSSWKANDRKVTTKRGKEGGKDVLSRLSINKNTRDDSAISPKMGRNADRGNGTEALAYRR